MNIDATTISLIALAVAILSLIISVFNSRVDRRIQFEQIRGQMVSALTSRGIDVLTQIDKLSNKATTKEHIEITNDLIKLAESMVNLRERLQKLSPPPFLEAISLPELESIRLSLLDTESIFTQLSKAIEEDELSSISRIIEGLDQRFNGK